MSDQAQELAELRAQNEALQKQLEELQKHGEDNRNNVSVQNRVGTQVEGSCQGGRVSSRGGLGNMLNDISDDLDLFCYFKLEIPRPIKLTSSNFDDWYSQMQALMELYGLGHVLEPLDLGHPYHKEITSARSKVVKLYIRNSLEGGIYI